MASRTSGIGAPMTGCGRPGRLGHQPCNGGGVHPFHLESITAGDDCAVLRIEGDIDAYAAPQLRDRVIDLAGNGTVHIIADLRAGGGSLTLVASTGRILQTLRIAGLSDVFALHSCVPDAISAGQHWQTAVSGDGDSIEEWCRKHGLLLIRNARPGK